MSEKLELAQKEIKQSIPQIFLGLGLSLILGISEIYKLFSQDTLSGNQIIGPLVSIAATAIWFFVPYLLKKENRNALTVLLIGMGLGVTRWIFIDKTFEFNLISVILISIFAWFILRFIKWIKVGALK
jgi:hypothetical protein